MNRNVSRLVFLLSCVASGARAAEQVGTITQTEGAVQLFSNPSKTLNKKEGAGVHALFEGEYYQVREAKIGDLVDQGNILRTVPGGRARVIFENGDQYNLGSGTAYRVNWGGLGPDANNGKPALKLMYGKLRGIIEKGGPRSKLTIRSRSATMGVRGTDFFISDDGVGGGTQVSVLRGEVDVRPLASAIDPKSELKAVSVKAGSTADITLPKPLPAIRKTTQEDLADIKQSSRISQAISPEMAPLEKKAVETTIKDIQKTDPTLFAKLDIGAAKSTEEINAKIVDHFTPAAPKALSKKKPGRAELENLEKSAYDKYFKIVE